MKLFIFLALVLLGFGTYWYLQRDAGSSKLEQAEGEIIRGAERLRQAVSDKVKEFSLDPEKIKEELAKSGKVARTKVKEATAALKDATADARVTAAIKAKLVADPELSALSISVNTTDGVVTLSGTAPSPEAVGRAILLALEMDGVREAVSTLQIRQAK